MTIYILYAFVSMICFFFVFFFFFFNDTAPTEIYTLSLHDALPICARLERSGPRWHPTIAAPGWQPGCLLASARLRSEEHTSELQSRFDLVCRLLLEKKKKEYNYYLLIRQ